MNGYDYIKSPTSGTVHLHDPGDHGRTLCGIPIFAAWVLVDRADPALVCRRCDKSLRAKGTS